MNPNQAANASKHRQNKQTEQNESPGDRGFDLNFHDSKDHDAVHQLCNSRFSGSLNHPGGGTSHICVVRFSVKRDIEQCKAIHKDIGM